MSYFEKLFVHKCEDIIENAPVQLMENAIIKDTVDNIIYLRNIFTNVSSYNVIAIIIEIQLYDITGTLIEDNGGKISYTYQDIKINPNDIFGNKTAIELPNSVRKVDVSIMKIVTENGEVIDYTNLNKIIPDAPEYIDIPESFLRTKDNNTNVPTIYPIIKDNYWQCTCGRINWKNEDVCGLCKRTLSVQHKYDKQAIEREYDEYVDNCKKEQREKELIHEKIKKEEAIKKQEKEKKEQEKRRKEQLERENKARKKKKRKRIIIGICLIILCFLSVLFVMRNNERKKQLVKEVKTAVDNIDISLGEINVIMSGDEPFMLGDSISDKKQKELENKLEELNNNKKIVDDAFKKENYEFIDQIQNYIRTNKEYDNWEEYNSKIQKLYKNSSSSKQAAENIIKDIAMTEEEYMNYKNKGFTLKDYDGEKLVDFVFDDNYDPFKDFSAYSEVVNGVYQQYNYHLKSFAIAYYGDEHPKDFKANFELVGTRGNTISETDWSFDNVKDDKYFHIRRINGERVDFSEVKKNGLNYGDSFVIFLTFYSNTEGTPTDIIMNVTSDE